jgi:acyl dehydratase
MPLDYENLMSLSETGVHRRFTDRDSLLYALAVGMGRDACDARELPFVYEGFGARVVPTLASVVAPSSLLTDCGWDYSRLLHGEQRLSIRRPLAEAGELLVDSDVMAAYDKGEGKGAVIYLRNIARDSASGEELFTQVRTLFARGDGGFGGPAGSGPAPHRIPARMPDMAAEFRTRGDQALLYRLCGDRNPLHADPSLARQLGYRAPILHGLCTYGIACCAVLRTVCEYDATLIRSFDARFTAPVFPGETVVTEMWQDANEISFRAHVVERDQRVLDFGHCVLAD